jgi:uncharacterized membrane protein
MSEPTPSVPVQPEPKQPGISDNFAGALAYFTFIPAVIFLIVEPYKKKSYVRFHAWQSILLTIAVIAINAILGLLLEIAIFIPVLLHGILWGLVQLAWLAIWLFCVISAFNGRRIKLPILGDLAEKQTGD